MNLVVKYDQILLSKYFIFYNPSRMIPMTSKTVDNHLVPIDANIGQKIKMLL